MSKLTIKYINSKIPKGYKRYAYLSCVKKGVEYKLNPAYIDDNILIKTLKKHFNIVPTYRRWANLAEYRITEKKKHENT